MITIVGQQNWWRGSVEQRNAARSLRGLGETDYTNYGESLVKQAEAGGGPLYPGATDYPSAGDGSYYTPPPMYPGGANYPSRPSDQYMPAASSGSNVGASILSFFSNILGGASSAAGSSGSTFANSVAAMQQAEAARAQAKSRTTVAVVVGAVAVGGALLYFVTRK